MKVHIPGVGDHVIHNVSFLPDPCPLPDKVKRSLDDKHKLLYAPMADVSGVLYDKDAVYVNVPGLYNKIGDKGEGEQMVIDLQDAQSTLDTAVKCGNLQIYSESLPLTGEYKESRMRRIVQFSTESNDESDSDEDDEDTSDDKKVMSDSMNDFSDNSDAEFVLKSSKTTNDIDIVQSDTESECGDAFDGSNKWKLGLEDRANSTYQKFQVKEDLMDKIYNTQISDAESSSNSEENTFRLKKKVSNAKMYLDRSKVETNTDALLLWEDEFYLDSIRSKFITGHEFEIDQEANDEEVGDFVDLENPDAHSLIPELSKEELLTKRKEDLKRKFDAKYDDESENDDNQNIFENAKEDMSVRQGRNETEFRNLNHELRASIEGYRPGCYVRIVIEKFPCEFINSFDPSYPIIIGGILSSEAAIGHLQARLILLHN